MNTNSDFYLEVKSSVENLPPLPIEIDRTVMGDPTYWEAPAPGVYFIRSTNALRDVSGPDRYYAIQKGYTGSVISADALACGTEREGVLYFEPEQGFAVIQYELLRKKRGHARPEEVADLDREMLDTAMFGAEYAPEYFGEWVPPMETPKGRVTRYKTVDRGVWFVEVGASWLLVVVYAQACADIYPERIKQSLGGENLHEDTCPYLFWEVQDCALPIYEMLHGQCKGLKNCLTSGKDLEAHICHIYPEYAAWHNRICEEQIKLLRAGNPIADIENIIKVDRGCKIRGGDDNDAA